MEFSYILWKYLNCERFDEWNQSARCNGSVVTNLYEISPLSNDMYRIFSSRRSTSFDKHKSTVYRGNINIKCSIIRIIGEKCDARI